ncbi:MAG: ABC transporter substrate-binding protein [Microbacteriaceae bacterium]
MIPFRRTAPILLSALLAAATLGGCSAASDDTAASTAASGWSYTDDTGATITLDAAPSRIAGFTDQVLSLLSYGIEPVAIFGRVDVASDSRFDDYDISDAAIVGNSYGEIDLEALAAAEPDLIVTGIYPTDREGTLDTEGPYYGVADVEQQQQLEAIAPVVAIEIGGAGLDVVESNTALAEALGAEADTVAAAKEEFEAASEALSAAAAANPGIEVTQMYADADGIYVVKPADEPETQLYQTLGVTLTDLNPDGDYYWDVYSWENAAEMMTGDVLLPNTEGFQAAELAEQPTFADDPALLADQVYEWQGAGLDYLSQAEQMTKLAEIIENAEDVV